MKLGVPVMCHGNAFFLSLEIGGKIRILFIGGQATRLSSYNKIREIRGICGKNTVELRLFLLAGTPSAAYPLCSTFFQSL